MPFAEAVNGWKRLGFATVDCRDAGLTESESLEQVRHVVHQWKTPFRAPYSGGSSFLQLILLRHALEYTISNAGGQAVEGTPPEVSPVQVAEDASPVSQALPENQPEASPMQEELAANPAEAAQSELSTTAGQPAETAGPDIISRPAHTQDPAAQPTPEEQAEEQDYLVSCVADIAEQLKAVPAKNSPAVSAIVLGGCKLLIATWEAQAFAQDSAMSRLCSVQWRRALFCTSVWSATKKASLRTLPPRWTSPAGRSNEMSESRGEGQRAKNIDAAVNLAATSKRLLSLIADGEKVLG